MSFQEFYIRFVLSDSLQRLGTLSRVHTISKPLTFHILDIFFVPYGTLIFASELLQPFGCRVYKGLHWQAILPLAG